MDLEKKVQILEQEIEILKHQIQTTLLDIKEQLLTNAYPTLRADLPVQPASSTPSSTQRIKPDQLIIEEDDDYDLADTEAGMPSVRKVSLEDINKSRSHSRTAGNKQTASSSLEWNTTEEMEDWVHETLAEAGLQRTRELIDLYTKSGRFTPAMREALLEMVRMQTRPAQNPANRQASPARSKAPASTTEKKSPNRSQHNSEQVVKQRTTSQQPANAGKQAQQNSAIRQKATAKQKSSASSEDDRDTKSNLVLRLIAAVQTAGVGGKRNSKNG